MPGPVPKRSEERRRRNKPEGPALAKVAASGAVVAPEPSEAWHAVAVAWYRSLADSGQVRFYEPSDWATAYYVAEAMSRNLDANARFSAQLFASVMSAMTDLLTTEGARRRARLEIEREQAEPETPAAVKIMDKYRKAANG